MASLRKRKGIFALEFVDVDGRRRLMSLDTRSERTASTLFAKINSLITSRNFNLPVEAEVHDWLPSISRNLRKRMTEFGLIGDHQRAAVNTLSGFLEDYISRRSDVKPATRTAWGHTIRNLNSFFDDDKPLIDITAGDAADFERFLKAGARQHGYAETTTGDALSAATIRKRIGNAKAFFQAAVEYELIERNPFAKFKTASPVNRKRSHFITLEDTEKLIDAAPDAQWRLLIALCRWGGLRNPSETLALRWEDVNFATGRMLVTSPKTEHHAGGENRWTPVFPELRPYLEDALELDPISSGPVVKRYRDPSQNLRSQFLKIIKRAGLKAWPKLFVNLRASRATELADQFPSHVCAAWLGHTEAIADRHYRQVTDEHFEQAILNTPSGAPRICRRTALHDAVLTPPDDEKTLVLQGFCENQWSLLDSNQ
ncbi:MAG: phage integrase SAM-like domain-containing protein [Planctomycetaceae bacterium]